MASPAVGRSHSSRRMTQKVRPMLVDAQPVRLRTRVRFPPPPLDGNAAKGRGNAPLAATRTRIFANCCEPKVADLRTVAGALGYANRRDARRRRTHVSR